MARDLTSARQNKALEAIQKRFDEQDDEAMRALMQTANGRQVVARLLRNFNLTGDGWDANSVRMTDFNAGIRWAARDIVGWVERVAGPEAHQMQVEAAQRLAQDEKTKEAAVTPPAGQQNGEDEDDG